MSKIVIVDYALGNLFNVKRAVEYVGGDAVISNDKKDIQDADKLILPGVGAFEMGMKQLETKGLLPVIKDAAKSGKYILGICLGMQLLMDQSEEYGQWEGLGLIPGQVVYFDPSTMEERFKLPQIGWNQLIYSQDQEIRRNDYWKGTILEGLTSGSQMYFVHSLYVKANNPQHSVAETIYGFNRFCSVVRKDNVMGCQFHPERSADDGLKIIRNFMQLK